MELKSIGDAKIKNLNKNETNKIILNIFMVIFTITSLLFIFYGYKTGLFTSSDKMEAFLGDAGIFAPLVFIVIQAVQVIFPILPFAIGTVAGVLVFGPFIGFIYNYIGICIGSIAAFLIAKKFGRPFLENIFSKATIDKYNKWTENKKFNLFFALAIFFPIAPDDFLCYLAGTTKMKTRFFVAVILLGKPLSLIVYSYGLDQILKFLTSL